MFDSIAGFFKSAWAFIVAALVAVLAWFNITIPGLGEDPTTTAPSTSITTVTTTTQAPAIPDALPFSIDIKVNGADLLAFDETIYDGLTIYTCDMKTVNSAGTETNYKFKGARLADILAAFKIGTNGLTGVKAIAGDGFATTYTAAQALDSKTLLAWYDELAGPTQDTNTPNPRLCPGSLESSGKYAKDVQAIELTYDIPAPIAFGNAIKIKVDGAVAFEFDETDLASLDAQTLHMKTVNSYGTVTDYIFTGVRLADILDYFDIDTASLVEVKAVDDSGSNPFSATYTAAVALEDTTILAWHNAIGEAVMDATYPNPRLCPGSSQASNLYMKNVQVIDLIF